MALWVDKHRPSALDRMDYHQDISLQLKQLASCSDVPHMLFYGPSGAGKKTRVTALLKELYGPTVEKLKIDVRTFQTPSNKKIDVNIIGSNYHIEVTPSDIGSYDRLVIQDLIKDIAQTQQVDSSSRRSFKVVVINEADYLSRDAQAALRRTMEKYMANLRVILICTSTSRIIAPVRSRCLLVRVSAPTNEEIVQILDDVATRESIRLPTPFAAKIAEQSGGNLRRAILMLEAAKVKHYPFSADEDVVLTDWEVFISEMAKYMVQEQSPKRLQDIRGKFYELLAHCISPDTIIKTLAFQLLKLVDATIAPEIMKAAAEYEHSMRLGSKSIFHLEAFAAKFMSIYKRHLVTSFGMLD